MYKFKFDYSPCWSEKASSVVNNVQKQLESPLITGYIDGYTFTPLNEVYKKQTGDNIDFVRNNIRIDNFHPPLFLVLMGLSFDDKHIIKAVNKL